MVKVTIAQRARADGTREPLTEDYPAADRVSVSNGALYVAKWHEGTEALVAVYASDKWLSAEIE
jgi:hypothetical protein